MLQWDKDERGGGKTGFRDEVLCFEKTGDRARTMGQDTTPWDAMTEWNLDEEGRKKADLAAHRGRSWIEEPENKGKNKGTATLGMPTIRLDRK